MNYPTITIEGAILSYELLDRFSEDDTPGQKPGDFGLAKTKVKDEIARVWAEAQDLWNIFKRQMEKETPRDSFGTTRTRNYWIVPFLGLLGYDPELAQAEIVQGKSFAMSHYAANKDRFPVHISGFTIPLDKKQKTTRGGMSTHAMVQEFLNLSDECLYALLTNGLQLRLLRDSSRLIRLSYLEFNLEDMMEQEHFADFAILFRLLHASRMPVTRQDPASCLMEHYHQDSLEDGARIRDGLSEAVKQGIFLLANGFLNHPANEALRKAINNNEITARQYFHHLLILVYRLLFLMVIEERHLVFTPGVDGHKKEIYYTYYSVSRLRRFCEQKWAGKEKHIDLWEGLKRTFRLFDETGRGRPLDILPLAGDLFSSKGLGYLNLSEITNDLLLKGIELLNWFEDKKTHHIIRVNYGSLNVEEFGSVYEGLLELEATFEKKNGNPGFRFRPGQERSLSGSHYTPEELVKPLILHSLDYIIEEKLKSPDKEAALLSITVCDPACGSGHVVLNAARRIGRELAKVRTGKDRSATAGEVQLSNEIRWPTPREFRHAVRDVIRNCIYGVDKNPLAVELCKIALWLEAHEPGKPLHFLDHHIKCGDSIVGLARKEELNNGIPTEAFKGLKGDDKTFLAGVRKRHIKEKKEYASGQQYIGFEESLKGEYTNIKAHVMQLEKMPEDTAENIAAKKKQYKTITTGAQWRRIKRLCDVICAQFFLSKTKENEHAIMTEALFHRLMNEVGALAAESGIKTIDALASEKGFFHWFLEFPEVMQEGGFDCILGNPPFLGGQKLSGFHGYAYLTWLQYAFSPAGAIDEVGFFFRRAFFLVKQKGFTGLISTNTISQGSTREGSLAIIEKQGGMINYAVRSTPWPGKAAVSVSLVTIKKGNFIGKRSLDNSTVDYISTYLDDAKDTGSPFPLYSNSNKSFQGSIVLGEGFILTHEEAKKLIQHDVKNKDVIFPYINGKDLNTTPDQSPSRDVINFFDWPLEKAREYGECFRIIEEKVKSERLKQKDVTGKEKWWLYLRFRPELYKSIQPLDKVLAIPTGATKFVNFSFLQVGVVYANTIVIIPTNHFYTFTCLQSTIHNEWAWKNCSSLETRLRYTPTDAFQTFPFPTNVSLEKEPGAPLSSLENLGAKYHEFRKELMRKMHLGLTKTYNQFHNPRLAPIAEDADDKEVRKTHGKGTRELRKHLRKTNGTCPFAEAVEGIFSLRAMHREIDLAVLKAYGWEDINPAHDFYEVDYLPENDRIRYTISPATRREVLKRLLELNHTRHGEEVAAGLVDEKGKALKKKKPKPKLKQDRDSVQQELF